MFGRSSDSIKAMEDIQRIKLNGGFANLSFSQVVNLISNTPDAQKNLTPEEFTQYREIFEKYRKKTKCIYTDINGYLSLCTDIINAYEKHFPYMLVDGKHSENLEMKDQIKIRKLYADGYIWEKAVLKYENEYDYIAPYKDYDPIKQPKAKQIFKIMELALVDFFTDCTFVDNSLENNGLIFGMLDAIYHSTGERFGADYTLGLENAITLYTMIQLAIYNYPDNYIDIIMKNRLETFKKYYPTYAGKPTSKLIEALAKDIIATFDKGNSQKNYEAVKKSFINYQQNILDALNTQLK